MDLSAAPSSSTADALRRLEEALLDNLRNGSTPAGVPSLTDQLRSRLLLSVEPAARPARPQ